MKAIRVLLEGVEIIVFSLGAIILLIGLLILRSSIQVIQYIERLLYGE